jgi:hypothetical protein
MVSCHLPFLGVPDAPQRPVGPGTIRWNRKRARLIKLRSNLVRYSSADLGWPKSKLYPAAMWESADRRERSTGMGLNRRPTGAYSEAMPIVAWCSAVRCSMPLECAVGRVVVVPCWSQSRHRQTTVSTDAIASMLITSVTGRQRVTVMVSGPFPGRAAVRSCGVGSRSMSWGRSAAGSGARGDGAQPAADRA